MTPPEFQLHPCQIPDRGRGQSQVRIVGEQRAARGRARRRGGPGVGGPGQPARGHRHQHVVAGLRCSGISWQVRKQCGIVRQRRDAVAGRVGQDVGHPVGIRQHQRCPCPQHLVADVARQLQGHELDQGDRIRRLPGRQGRVEQEEFGRTPPQRIAVYLGDARIHARGIGVERIARARILRIERLHRQRIEIEPAQQLVRLDRARAENLREPALHGAAHQRHLPQAVLRMGIAEAEERVPVGLRHDVRHVGIVAYDLDIRGQSGHGERLVVVGQRARSEILHHEKCQDDQDEGGGHEAQQPLKQDAHVRFRPVSDVSVGTGLPRPVPLAKGRSRRHHWGEATIQGTKTWRRSHFWGWA